MRRAVVSIPSNIAEGAGRKTKLDFCKFLDIAYGSSCELETQLIIAKRLKFVNENNINNIFDSIDFIQKMITNLKKTYS